MLSECKADVSSKLPAQATGEFFLVRAGEVAPVRSLRSVVLTDQVAEAEIVELARG